MLFVKQNVLDAYTTFKLQNDNMAKKKLGVIYE